VSQAQGYLSARELVRWEPTKKSFPLVLLMRAPRE
jgi:hypothetical protein